MQANLTPQRTLENERKQDRENRCRAIKDRYMVASMEDLLKDSTKMSEDTGRRNGR